jgi:phage terminase large subunit-like protein
VVAIDPAVSSGDDSDETGLIVAALSADGRGVLLDDLSGRMPALDWAQRAIEAYHLHQADCLIAEVNNGGDLVEKLIHSLDPTVAYKGVRATRGKWVRAEPIAALYSQRRVIHARSFPELEAQLKEYTPHTSSFSPDRLDALVWALTELLLQPKSYQTTFEPKVWRI